MIYILHLETPLHHAKHYVGFSTDGRTLKQRIAHHENGTAHCRFTQVLRERGIHFTLARVFKGREYDRSAERQLKNSHNAPRYCPICNPNPPPFTPRKNENPS